MSYAIDQLKKSIEREVRKNNFYKNFDSTSMFDSSALNFNQPSVLDYDEDKGQKVVGLSTYSLSVRYVPGAGPNLPVQFELFGTNWNTGTVVGQTLVFQNAGGDQAIVTGITAPITVFQEELRSAIFRAKWVRQVVVNAAQFGYQYRLQQDKIYGSGKYNTLNPEEFITPEQYQLLRVDVQLNTAFDTNRRFISTCGPTEIGVGTKYVFWIDGVTAPIEELNGKSPVINMGGDGIQQNAPTIPSAQAINELVKLQGNTLRLLQLSASKSK